GNTALLRHRAKAIGVAGEGQGAIRQRENEAAVAQAVPIDHAFGQRHGELGPPGTYLQNFHAEALAGLVLGPQGLRTEAGDFGRLSRHALLPLTLGVRFSRKAVMPSAPSGEAPASCCSSRSRSSWVASVLPLAAASARLLSAKA